MSTNKEILLVDDDRDIRDSLKIILEKSGFAVRTAGNGQEALAELQRGRPDLLILDVMMSTDTEGIEIAMQVRDRPDLAGLPVILLTSFLDKVREEGPDKFQNILGEQWPAKWLFEKPVNTPRLLAKIKEIFGGG